MINQIENRAQQGRPLGIILIVLCFAILNGLLGIIFSIPLLFMLGFKITAWIKLFLVLVSIVQLAISVLSFAACYGLWLLIEWGRKLAITICAISIPLGLFSLMIPWPGQETTSGIVVWVIMSIVVDILIIWYLLKENIKALFPKTKGLNIALPLANIRKKSFCTQCGAEVGDAAFCSECGKKL